MLQQYHSAHACGKVTITNYKIENHKVLHKYVQQSVYSEIMYVDKQSKLYIMMHQYIVEYVTWH